MKKKNTYITFLLLGLMLPGLVFGASFSVNTSSLFGVANNFTSATDNFYSTQGLPFQSEIPSDNSNENQLFTIDIEEIIEPCDVKYYVVSTTYVCHVKKVMFRYKEQGNLQFQPNIVPPPPKK